MQKGRHTAVLYTIINKSFKNVKRQKDRQREREREKEREREIQKGRHTAVLYTIRKKVLQCKIF
jgi:hypothetical protein